MEILEVKSVSPIEVKENLKKYGGTEENPIISKVLDNLDEIFELSEEDISKLKDVGLSEEEIYKIIEINPKNKEILEVLIKDREKLESVVKILFGEQ